MTILTYGERALLVEVAPNDVADFVTSLKDAGIPEIVSIVPAARTVLVEVRSPGDLGGLKYQLDGFRPEQHPMLETELVIIPVTYDGDDLEWVAQHTQLSVDAVVELHTGTDYRVQFCGFSPGFGYISGLDERLHLPRRSSPRTSVPKGSVSIANGYSAVYTSSTPGGWHLLGRTDIELFNPDRFDEGLSPSVLRPGVGVRFEAL